MLVGGLATCELREYRLVATLPVAIRREVYSDRGTRLD